MLINNQLIITTMETLFEVTQSMVAMAEHGTFHLDDEIEVSALILCVVAIILAHRDEFHAGIGLEDAVNLGGG